jgi:microcystin-dependent protein
MKIKVTTIDFEIPRRTKRLAMIVGVPAAVILGAAALAYAGVPNTFSSGEALSSSQMNANFSALDGRLTTLETAAPSVPPGTVAAFAGATAPAGWVLCDGSEYDGTSGTYAALYTAVGVTFGDGNASAGSFNVPDLRGRVVVAAGSGAGLTPRTVAQSFGEETHTLSVAEMPSHDHTIYLYAAGSGPNQGTWNFNWGSVSVFGSQAALPATYGGGPQNFIGALPAGGGAAHNVMQPSLVLSYVIKL